MPAHGVNAATRLAEASWRRDKDSKLPSGLGSRLRMGQLLWFISGQQIVAIAN